MARHHDDVDAAFRGWRDVWLDPAFPAWTIVGVEQVAAGRQGVASGLLTTTQEVGASVGFAAMIAVAATVTGDLESADATADGFRSAIVAGAAIAALGAVLSTLTPRDTRAIASRASDFGQPCADGVLAPRPTDAAAAARG